MEQSREALDASAGHIAKNHYSSRSFTPVLIAGPGVQSLHDIVQDRQLLHCSPKESIPQEVRGVLKTGELSKNVRLEV